MILFWVKLGNEVICGEAPSSETVPRILCNPMTLQYFNVTQPSKIHGRSPDQVTAFRFIPISCAKILIADPAYFGEVDKHDPVYVTFYKVLESKQKAQQDPLNLTQ